jgi:hypothetical protein
MSPRLLRPRAGGGFHPDAQDWRKRVITNGGTVSGSTLTAVSNFCRSIDAAGLRDRFYRLNLFCGTELSACLVPLYRGQSHTGTQFGNTTDTNNNFVSGDYTETGASGGLIGNGTNKYLNTGLATDVMPAISSFHLSQSVRDREAAGAGRSFVGMNDTSAGQIVALRQEGTTGNIGGLIARTTPTTMAYAAADSHAMVSRTSLSLLTLYRSGVSQATDVTTITVASSSRPLFVFCRNSTGTPTDYTGLRARMYSIGIGMDGTQAANFAVAVEAFNVALGREIVTGPPLSTSTSGWTGNGSELTKLARATLTGTNTNSNTITINSAGLLRITATTSGVGDGAGGLMTIVTGGQAYTGNSGGSLASWTIDITRTVTVGQTITFASEYADGTFNSLQAWIIPPDAPPAPTSLTSPSQSSGSVYLTWAAPANDGGSAITDYAVQYSSNSGSTWTTFSRSASTALNATVTGLTNGTAYQFRVAGVNSVGTGTYSSTATATPTSGNSLTASDWSGAGTNASRLAPPASPATFTGSPSITVGTSGTLNVSIVSDDNYNDGWEVIIFLNGTEIYRADGNFNFGSPYTRTFAVTAGQTIALETSGGGARWFATTRLWVT